MNAMLDFSPPLAPSSPMTLAGHLGQPTAGGRRTHVRGALSGPDCCLPFFCPRCIIAGPVAAAPTATAATASEAGAPRAAEIAAAADLDMPGLEDEEEEEEEDEEEEEADDGGRCCAGSAAAPAPAIAAASAAAPAASPSQGTSSLSLACLPRVATAAVGSPGGTRPSLPGPAAAL